MQTSAAGLKLIQTAESLSLKTYYDSASIATIGWGHALFTPGGQLIKSSVFGRAKADQLAGEAVIRTFGKAVLTREDCDAQLAKDLAKFESTVSAACDASTAQCEFDAMMSFCFNVGQGSFVSSSIARLHKAGARTIGNISISALCQQSKARAAPAIMPIAFVRWCNAGGVWTLGLFRRRVAELLVYGGHDVSESIKNAWAFHD